QFVSISGRHLWLGRIVAIFSISVKLELFMLFREQFAGLGFVEWILFPANLSKIGLDGAIHLAVAATCTFWYACIITSSTSLFRLAGGTYG
ncbi:MAG TPA: hypothetical protein VM260_26260, partial [Pirellula sp.]|nr:hypothetical protein [Pirellula sp.]